MSLIGLILTLVVVGVLLWLLNNYVPMDSKIKTIINVVVVIVVVIWLLQAFGVLGSLRDVRIRELPPFDTAKEDRTMREMLTTPQIVMTAIKKARGRVVFDIEGVSPLEVF